MSKRKRVIPDSDWKPIPGFEGLYEVSRCGVVRSLSIVRPHGGYRPRTMPGKILSPKKHYGGVTLWDLDGKSHSSGTHRLVALAWIPNPDNHPLVRHLDDDSTNHHVENLAWGNSQLNYLDGRSNGIDYHNSLTLPQRKKVEHAVRCELLRNQNRWYGQGRKLADAFQVSEHLISRIRRKLIGGQYA